MSCTNTSLNQFLSDLAARQPTPGGGSASALAGAQGAALGGMVAAFTTGNEKYKTVENRARQLEADLAALRLRFLQLMDSDIAAYASYSAARKLPKNTPEEKGMRSTALAQAREAATIPPEQMIDAALEGFRLLEELAAIANVSMAADLAAAAYALEAAARGAVFQVFSNCAASDTEGIHARRRAAVGEKAALCRQARERIEQVALKMMKL